MTIIYILIWALALAFIISAGHLIEKIINKDIEYLDDEVQEDPEVAAAMDQLVESGGWKIIHPTHNIQGVDPITSDKGSVSSADVTPSKYQEGDLVVMNKSVNNDHFFEDGEIVLVDVVREFDKTYYVECMDGIGQFVREDQIKYKND